MASADQGDLLFRRDADGSVCFSVYATPRASKSQIVGEFDGALKIALAAPPVDGAANSELIALLSNLLGVGKRQIDVIHGHTGRRKLVRIVGVDVATLHKTLTGQRA